MVRAVVAEDRIHEVTIADERKQIKVIRKIVGSNAAFSRGCAPD